MENLTIIVCEGKKSAKYISFAQWNPINLDDPCAKWEEAEVTPFVYTEFLQYEFVTNEDIDCNTLDFHFNLGVNTVGTRLTPIYQPNHKLIDAINAMRIIERLPIINNSTIHACSELATRESIKELYRKDLAHFIYGSIGGDEGFRSILEEPYDLTEPTRKLEENRPKMLEAVKSEFYRQCKEIDENIRGYEFAKRFKRGQDEGFEKSLAYLREKRASVDNIHLSRLLEKIRTVSFVLE